jgi:hypothetical protein
MYGLSAMAHDEDCVIQEDKGKEAKTKYKDSVGPR